MLLVRKMSKINVLKTHLSNVVFFSTITLGILVFSLRTPAQIITTFACSPASCSETKANGIALPVADFECYTGLGYESGGALEENASTCYNGSTITNHAELYELGGFSINGSAYSDSYGPVWRTSIPAAYICGSGGIAFESGIYEEYQQGCVPPPSGGGGDGGDGGGRR